MAIKRRKNKDKRNLTLSALLNSLDGVTSADGRVVFMTTNYPDALDEALLRPGRIDRHEKIGELGTPEVRRLFLRFWPERPDLIPKITLDRPVTGAIIQEHFLRYKDDPEGAVNNLMHLGAKRRI